MLHHYTHTQLEKYGRLLARGKVRVTAGLNVWSSGFRAVASRRKL
jgi:hypothetical protein